MPTTDDRFRGTTVLCVRHRGRVVIAGDGQVTLGQTVLKHQAKKIRKLYHGTVLTGFAGATADAFTLFEKLEGRIEQHKGSLVRSAVELVKEWRTDKILRRLEAMLIAADREHSLLISGAGDVIEPDDGVLAIGSGGPYALAAARALVAHSMLTAEEIARSAMGIAASVCIYTNENICVEGLETGEG